MQMGPTMEGAVVGREEILAMQNRELRNAKTVHQFHAGEFVFHKDGTVTVLWPMQDIVESNLYLLKGAGYYKEKYVQVNGEWKISHWRLLRTRIDFKPKGLALRLVLLAQSCGLLKLISPATSLKLTQTTADGFDAKELEMFSRSAC